MYKRKLCTWAINAFYKNHKLTKTKQYKACETSFPMIEHGNSSNSQSK